MTPRVEPADSPAEDRLTVPEAAAFLGEKPHVISRLCREKRIPHYRLGRFVRLSRVAILAWREQQLQPPTAA
jgi:excisionase family DNA binding protein